MVRYLRLIAVWAAPLLFVAVLFYWPLTKILALGFEAGANSVALGTSTLAAVWFTIWQAALSTVICLLLGVPGAYLLYRRQFRGRNALRVLITLPLVLPTIVIAIAFVAFQNLNGLYSFFGIDQESNSIFWIIAAHVFINYSLSVRSIGGVWATLDLELEEAAELAGAGRFRTLVSISLPQLRSAIVSAAALTFLFCATSYGVILILGGGLVHSLETEIASAAVQYLDLGKAALLAMFQTGLTIAALGLSTRIGRRAVSLEQIDESARLPRLSRRDWAAIAVTAPTILGLIGVPLVSVLIKSFQSPTGWNFDNFTLLATRGERDLLNVTVFEAASNSLRNVLISTSLAIVIGSAVSFLLSRNIRNRGHQFATWLLDLAFLLPMGISSVVLAFGYLITFNGEPFALRTSWLAVPLIQSLMATPLVIRMVYPALESISPEQREAAATAGATSGQTWWYIELGIIRHVFVTAIGYAAIASIGEYGAASLLTFGNQATLPTVLFQLISRPGSTNFGMAMAIAAILVVLTYFVVALVAIRRPRPAFLSGR
ncbi:MAG: ABC transporter permease [Micrococcales bacterium]